MRFCLGFLLLLTASCALVDPEGAERRAQGERDRRAAGQAKIDRIVVVPGDLSRPYRILGPVRVGSEVFDRCLPDDVRREALDKYGQVDAVIGFIQSAGPAPGVVVTGSSYCEGTAVVFE